MAWLRGLLFSNWRNRGVAMFFALIIWFVSFQSEKQSWTDEVRVVFRPQDSDRYVITDTQSSQIGESSKRVFDGGVNITLEGPRKQVEEWKTSYRVRRRNLSIDVPPQTKEHFFGQSDFDLPEGVTVTTIVPKSVYIEQDQWDTKTVPDLTSRLNVSFTRPSHQVGRKRVEPNELTLRGPRSILDSVDIELSVRLELNYEFDGEQTVELRFTDPSIPQSAREQVTIEPQTVNVLVNLQASNEELSEDSVRVTFRVPPGYPIEIRFPEERIPLRFEGRQNEITRLREKFAQDSSSVEVSVEVLNDLLNGRKEAQLVFTEDELEVPGFPGINVRQHVRRKGQGPFTALVVPCQSEGEE